MEAKAVAITCGKYATYIWFWRVFTLLVCLCYLPLLNGTTLTWTGNAGDGLIGTGGNWSPSQSPVNGDVFIFAGTNSLSPQLSSALTVGSITFNNTAGAFTLGGAGTYTVNASGITNNSTNTETINNAITLGGAQSWSASSANLVFGGNVANGGFLLTIAGTSNTSASGVISGTGGLTQNGSGTLTLSGANSNTFTGTTSVNDGTLQLNKTAGKNAMAGSVVVGDGTGAAASAVTLWLASNQAPNIAFTVNSDGQLNLNNFTDTIGTLTMTAGSVVTGTGSLTLGGDVTTNAASTTATITGTLGTSANRTFTVADGSAAVDLQISADITGNHGVIKAGTGTLVLSGNNVINALQVNAGVVNVQTAASFGTAAPVVASGAALQIQGGFTFGKNFTLNGSGISNDGALRNISGNNTLTGNISLNTDSFIGVDAGSLTLTGTVSGNGINLTKVGSGTLILNGTANNTNTGVTTVNNGTLQLNMTPGKNAVGGNLVVGDGTGAANSATTQWLGSNQIANKSVSVNTDGLADLNNFSDTIGSLTMTGGSVTTGTGTLTLGGDVTGNAASTSATISGNLGLGANRIFNIADGSAAPDMAVSAVVSGAFTVTKNGTGTLVFSGANTYTGATTINAGVLDIQNATGLGTTAAGTTVNSGGTLAIEGGITVGAEALSIVGTGASGQTGALVNVSGTNNYGGLLTLTGATTLSSDSGTLNLTNPGTITGNTFGLTLNGAGNGSISSIIGTTTGSLTKNGSGTWTLTGVNTYTGGSTINAGTLAVNSSASLGAITGGLTINAGTLEVTTGFSTTRTITLGDAASTFQVDPSQTYTVTTAIGGSGNLNKTGSGTMVLGATETYSGSTNVSAGTLQLNASNRIPDASAVTVSGGTLDVQTFTDTVGAVTLSGGTIAGTGAGTLTGSSYSLQSGSASAILAGSGTITKSTAGTVTLTGANTMSGAVTINGGTLTAAAASGSALGSVSSIQVNSGGTLQLGANDQINNSATMTLGGGTLAKGNFNEGSTGSVGIGALTLSAGSHVDFGTGTVGALSFASLNPAGFTLTIDNWTGNYGQQGSGSTDRLIFDSDQSANLNNFFFTGYGLGGAEFALAGGFYEVVAAVPETSTWASAALSLVGLVYWHVRARRRQFHFFQVKRRS